MKAVMVIDMPDIPKNCMSCPLIGYHREYSIVCRHYQTGDARPSWCPLRPMPEQMSWGHSADYIYGYNDCLDEILGETE